MSQAQAGTAPQAPPTPPTPATPQVATEIFIPGDYALPTTRAQLENLRRTRSEISDQLINVSNRRAEVAADLVAADPAARPGLQQRLDVLDAGIVQLEQALAQTRQLVTVAEANLGSGQGLAAAAPFGGLDSDQITGISIVFTIFVLFPIALSMARFVWKRATAPRAIRNTGDSERLERVEHAVETIAIEVERISEGQRFVTKLLAQPNGMPLSVAQRQSEPVPGSTERR